VDFTGTNVLHLELEELIAKLFSRAEKLPKEKTSFTFNCKILTLCFTEGN
jgi:hypothetical protein